MNIMQLLSDSGINPHACVMVAESLLRSPVAGLSTQQPLQIVIPVRRHDCPGWSGVRITLEAIPTAMVEREAGR